MSSENIDNVIANLKKAWEADVEAARAEERERFRKELSDILVLRQPFENGLQRKPDGRRGRWAWRWEVFSPKGPVKDLFTTAESAKRYIATLREKGVKKGVKIVRRRVRA